MDVHRFELTASPHIKGPDSTPRIMWSVVATLVPVVGAAIYWFGPSAALVITTATVGCVVTERLFGPGGTLRDGSAAITGVLLGLTLPPGIPLWMAFVGGFIAIGLGKLVFGGLGQNVFNPALLGRALLQAAFPDDMTTWPAAVEHWWQLRGDNFALPLTSADPTVALTGATPLGQMKFEQIPTEAVDLFMGATSGSTGETAAVVILAGGIYLAVKKYLNWRIPISILLTVAVLSQVAHFVDPDRYPGALFMLFSGGLMLGAWYMATDMVTSPTTNHGCWIFGAGIGAMAVLIRLWGGLPEGVMYSILFMNALVPFINRATQPRVFGTGEEVVAS
ncbi:MAG: RnfABCDGE type electron transport complex subunit D [Gemmatimonadota bacterium]|nr:RnfABCDGE type electron transport complex subunit D [Gemmatimonadota bacterium]MDH3424114.1 RnfABCDGE type electron transport complex subunit D [Gemmatimonadota bacterium]